MVGDDLRADLKALSKVAALCFMVVVLFFPTPDLAAMRPQM